MRPNDHSPLIRGIAQMLWWLAWSDHAEETRCTRLSGEHIEQTAPPVPEVSYRDAYRLAGKVEQANGKGAHALLYQAAQADGKPFDDPGSKYAERFGECLAYMATGHGVSWFDDHADFPLVVPGFDPDLCSDDAAEHCEACGK